MISTIQMLVLLLAVVAAVGARRTTQNSLVELSSFSTALTDGVIDKLN